jgi:hypothetical protein
VSFASTEVFDDDGITLRGTSTDPDPLDPEMLEGDAMGEDDGRFIKLPRTIVVTLEAAPGKYNFEDPIVVTGRRGNKVVTESFTPSDADGGEALIGTQMFDVITAIDIPAQAEAGGQIKFGVQDIGTPHAYDSFSAVKMHAEGTLNVQYGEPDGSQTDAIPCLAGDVEQIAPTRILTSPALDAPTTVGLTVYLP